jgi:hypothetical protein
MLDRFLDLTGSLVRFTLNGNAVRAYVSGVSSDCPQLWPNGTAHVVLVGERHARRIDVTHVQDLRPD